MTDELYLSKIKLPELYFQKYKKVPKFPGTGKFSKSWIDWSNHDFARAWCLLDFIDWTKNISGESLCFTCWDDPELEFIYSKYQQQTYLPYPPYDLHNDLKTFHNRFEFFLFNQTLEHIHNPFVVMNNINKIMKKDGYVFTSAPTINIPHMTPNHFYGYTPMGLAMLFHNTGFEIVQVGQWGNYDYIQKLFKTHAWPDFHELKDADGNVTNEEENCCQCWVLAKKL